MGSLSIAPRRQRLADISPAHVVPYDPTADSGGWVAMPRRTRTLLRDKTSGAAQILLILYLQELLWGDRGLVKAGKRQGSIAWTKPLSKRTLARECGGLTERALDPIIEDAVKRGIMAVEPHGRGEYRYALLPDQWESVPDYQPPPLRKSAPEPEPEKGEEKANLHGSALPRSRVVLLPGKPHTMTLGEAVSKVRIESNAPGAAHHEVAHGEVRIWFETAVPSGSAHGSALPGGTNTEQQIQRLTISAWTKHLEALFVESGLIRRFGETPDHKFAAELQKLAGRATLSHFDATFEVNLRKGKIRSAGYLRMIAEQCAKYAGVWARSAAPQAWAAGARPTEPMPDELAEEVRNLRAIANDPTESEHMRGIAREQLQLRGETE